MLADYHMHTNYSNDSQYDMEKAILKAIDMGLDEICFTEHSDYGTMGNYVVDYEDYYQGYLKWKEKYKNQIVIKLVVNLVCKCIQFLLFKKIFKSIHLIL